METQIANAELLNAGVAPHRSDENVWEHQMILWFHLRQAVMSPTCKMASLGFLISPAVPVVDRGLASPNSRQQLGVRYAMALETAGVGCGSVLRTDASTQSARNATAMGTLQELCLQSRPLVLQRQHHLSQLIKAIVMMEESSA